jgi:hypothetical protein
MLPFNGYAKAAQIVGAFAAAMLLTYVPFLYTGDWNNAVPTDFFIIIWGIIALFYSGVFLKLLLKESRVKQHG